MSYVVTFRGKSACPCLAAWLPVFEAELQRRGLLSGPLRIYQLIGGVAASGGTHANGGAFDLLDLPGEEDLVVARQMGADATWSRLLNWDGRNGMAHIHGVLRGCPHNGPASYQIAAVDAGYNGLGSGGRGARDDGPRPLTGRDWRQGIEWAQLQEDSMALTDEDVDKVIDRLLAREIEVEGASGDKKTVSFEQAIRQGANSPGVIRRELKDAVDAIKQALRGQK